MKLSFALLAIPFAAAALAACGVEPSAIPASSPMDATAEDQTLSPTPLFAQSPSASPSPVVQVDATEIADLIRAEVSNATEVVTFTPANDVHHVLGTGAGYAASAASIRDDRIQIKSFKEQDLGVVIVARSIHMSRVSGQR